MIRSAVIFFVLFAMLLPAFAAEDPVTKMKDSTLSYFSPINGQVTRVEGKTLTLSLGEKDMIKPGMRARVLREGAPFRHPVTREPLGNIESTVGKIGITEVQTGSSKGTILEGDAKEGDKIRISATKVRMLFCQEKNADWYLADDLYKKLKATGRVEMIDTSMETGDEKKVLEEAKRLNAEVAIMVATKPSDKGLMIRERLLWVSDGLKFFDEETVVTSDYLKELRVGERYFAPQGGESLMTYDLPYGASYVLLADLDGDGKQEIVLDNGKNLRVYSPGADLQLLWELKGPENHIWIDSIDLKKNGRDALVINSLQNNQVLSSIYELKDSKLVSLWEGKYFIKKLGNELIAQAYSASEGFGGDIFMVKWEDGFSLGEKIRTPKGVNIFDFVLLEGTAKERLIFAYDEKGFLHLYDDKGLKVWNSNIDMGGFLNTFKNPSPVAYLEGSEWSVKDRLVARQREVLVPQRVPIAGMVKGIGYKSSRIRGYWWNGFTMEESILIDDISGKVLDFSVAGDKVVVLTSPPGGLKFGNILKGENPLGVVLHIYTLKGR